MSSSGEPRGGARGALSPGPQNLEGPKPTILELTVVTYEIIPQTSTQMILWKKFDTCAMWVAVYLVEKSVASYTTKALRTFSLK